MPTDACSSVFGRGWCLCSEVTAPLLLVEVLKPLLRDMPTDSPAPSGSSSPIKMSISRDGILSIHPSIHLSIHPSRFKHLALKTLLLQPSSPLGDEKAWLVLKADSRPILKSPAFGLGIFLQCQEPSTSQSQRSRNPKVHPVL